jgi:hypothetical protein
VRQGIMAEGLEGASHLMVARKQRDAGRGQGSCSLQEYIPILPPKVSRTF